MSDNEVIKAALSEAIAKREREKSLLIAELERIEQMEREAELWTTQAIKQAPRA